MMLSKLTLLLCLLAGSAAFSLPQPQPKTVAWSSSALSLSSGGADAPPPDLKPPPALYQGAVAAGAAKAAAPLSKIFTMGVVAGCHIAFGAYLAITVGGACPELAKANPGLQKIVMVSCSIPGLSALSIAFGLCIIIVVVIIVVVVIIIFLLSFVISCLVSCQGAFGLPFGLIMVLVSGAELFTGNTALVTAAYMEGKTSGKDLLKNWIGSYLGNFVGSLLLAYLVFKSGTLGDLPGAVNLAVAKSNLSWTAAFTRGILCNCKYRATLRDPWQGRISQIIFNLDTFFRAGLHGRLYGLWLCVDDWKNDGRVVSH